MSHHIQQTNWMYTMEVDVNGFEIYFAINDTGEIKIGSKAQYRNGHLSGIVIGNGLWYTLYGRFGEPYLLCLKVDKNQNVWCNLGPNLNEDQNEDQNEFPFLLLSNLRWLLLQKKSNDIIDSNWEKALDNIF